MAAYTGPNMYLLFNGTALHADYRSFEHNEEMGVEDASAGNDTARLYATTLKDGNASITMRSVSGTAGTARWINLPVGSSGTLEWGPEGTATGKIRGYVNAILSSRTIPTEYDQVAEWNYEFQYSGAVTYTTY